MEFGERRAPESVAEIQGVHGRGGRTVEALLLLRAQGVLNSVDINEVGSTAFFPSCVRQMEQDEARPLFEDPYAAMVHRRGGDATVPKAHPHVSCDQGDGALPGVHHERDPGARDSGRREAKSSRWARASTCALKFFAPPGVRFCDVDQPGVLAFKRNVLEARGVAPCAAIPGDYLELDLPGELAKISFDLDAPTLFIWEGNTMYLPAELIHDFLEPAARADPAASSSPSIISQNILSTAPPGDETMTAATNYFERTTSGRSG